MENEASAMIMINCIRALSFTILILSIYATVNIYKSMWLSYWASRYMDDRQKREFYVKNKYDIKWAFCMMIMLLLVFVLFQMIGLKNQSWVGLLCAFLFGFLLWGNYRTLNIDKERLKRKKDFGI